MKPQTAQTSSFLLGQDAGTIPCKDLFRKPMGTPGQFHRECTMKFVSAYCYHQQLFQQIEREKTQKNSISQSQASSIFFCEKQTLQAIHIMGQTPSPTQTTCY